MTDQIKKITLLVDKIASSRACGKSVLDIDRAGFIRAANLFFNSSFEDSMVLNCAANLAKLGLTNGATDGEVNDYSEVELIQAFDISAVLEQELNEARANRMTKLLGGSI